MLLQFIRGKVTDREAFERLTERWVKEMKPSAIGFLGATGGILPDGTLVEVARFASVSYAQTYSNSPEQGAWWNDYEKTIADVSFQDFTDGQEWRGGGSNDAGFVQIITGRVTDRATLEGMESD